MKLKGRKLDGNYISVNLDMIRLCDLGSRYPLWLTLACEELRVFGVFEEVTQKITQLPDELIDLEESVFERLVYQNEILLFSLYHF